LEPVFLSLSSAMVFIGSLSAVVIDSTAAIA
jgi:hypothetical protein